MFYWLAPVLRPPVAQSLSNISTNNNNNNNNNIVEKSDKATHHLPFLVQLISGAGAM